MDVEATSALDVGAPVTMSGARQDEWQVYYMRQIAEWSEQCSKHLSFIEKRAMEAEYEAHEVVRQFGHMIEEFVPPPRGEAHRRREGAVLVQLNATWRLQQLGLSHACPEEVPNSIGCYRSW